MNMIIHEVSQGTDAWHALRADYLTASEAPAMMGASKYVKRTDLLHAKKTGLDRDVHWWVQRFLFDRGHEVEAMARPIIEEIIGEELYPVVATRGKLMASLDGMTLSGAIIWEHKLWNAELAEQVRAGTLDPHYTWQLDQQLHVTGAEQALFAVSDGTRENMVYLWYRPDPARVKQLHDGWDQFEADLAEFVPTVAEPTPIGRRPEDLPALRIELTGMVTSSNLKAFREHAMAVLGAIKTDLQTDQDFADADRTVKWCKEVEDRLGAAKQHALSQTSSIEEVFRTIDEIIEETRTKRLELDKLVKARKDAIRLEIKVAAEQAAREHVATLEKRLVPVKLPTVPTDFAGAMKGKKTVASLQDAVDTELARFKIAANNLADKMDANLRTIRAAGNDFLFADLQSLAVKEPEDLAAIIETRIAQHEQAEEQRLERERERIRLEEEAKARVAAVQPQPYHPAAQVDSLPPASDPAPAAVQCDQVAASEPITDEVPVLRLGEICERLGFNVSADYLRSIGVAPAGRERSSILYRESDFDRICVAIINHIASVRTVQYRTQPALV